METPEIIIVDQFLGKGAENLCFKIKDEDYVIKVPNIFGKLWQEQSDKYREFCLDALIKENIKHIQTEIVRKPIIIVISEGKDPCVIQPEFALKSPYVHEIDSLSLKYNDLKNPEIQEQLIDLARKAERIFEEKKLGVDPYGGAVIGDFVKGAKHSVFNTIKDRLPLLEPKSDINKFLFNTIKTHLPASIKPEKIKEYIDANSDPVLGQMRNVIIQNEEICLTDIGMHNLDPKIIDDLIQQGLFKTWRKIMVQGITKPMYHLMWLTLTEMLVKINPLLDDGTMPFRKSLPMKQEVERLFFRLISKMLVDFMVPKFEEYDRTKGNL